MLYGLAPFEGNYTNSQKLALFVAALDQTIVSTALPTIASELHSASGYTWVGSAYLLANAAAAPIWYASRPFPISISNIFQGQIIRHLGQKTHPPGISSLVLRKLHHMRHCTQYVRLDCWTCSPRCGWGSTDPSHHHHHLGFV